MTSDAAIPGAGQQAEAAKATQQASGNSAAAWFALVALVIFLVAIFIPSIEITEFGSIRSLSLLGGIGSLWTSGHYGLAVLIFFFTILFPPAKLLAIGLLAAPVAMLPTEHHGSIRKVVSNLGKWSLLDVLVIAIFVVAIKARGLVTVQATSGTYLFTITIILSMLAAHLAGRSSVQGAVTRRPPMTSFGRVVLPWLHSRSFVGAGVVFLPLGVVLWLTAPSGLVENIRVTKRDGLIDIDNPLRNPSYYVVVMTLQGPLRLRTVSSMPIGNGLRWRLERPMRLSDAARVELHNKGWLFERLVDQVEVDGRRMVGQKFQFELRGQAASARVAGMFLTAVGSLCASVGLVARLMKPTTEGQGTETGEGPGGVPHLQERV